MDIKAELLQPEFKKYSLANWGQLLKIATSLPPEVFPYRVGIPSESPFFLSLHERVYEGKGIIVENAKKTVRMGDSPLGTAIERTAIMGANDLGELSVQSTHTQGQIERIKKSYFFIVAFLN